MKVTTGSGGFKPVEINITLESKEEAQAFYAIFNHGRIMDVVPLDGDKVRYEINKATNGGIDYGDYHDKLSESFKG